MSTTPGPTDVTDILCADAAALELFDIEYTSGNLPCASGADVRYRGTYSSFYKLGFYRSLAACVAACERTLICRNVYAWVEDGNVLCHTLLAVDSSPFPTSANSISLTRRT